MREKHDSVLLLRKLPSTHSRQTKTVVLTTFGPMQCEAVFSPDSSAFSLWNRTGISTAYAVWRAAVNADMPYMVLFITWRWFITRWVFCVYFFM